MIKPSVYVLFKCSIGLNSKYLLNNQRGKEEGSHILSFTTSQDLFQFYRLYKGNTIIVQSLSRK